MLPIHSIGGQMANNAIEPVHYLHSLRDMLDQFKYSTVTVILRSKVS